MQTEKRAEILIVDDDAGHAELVSRHLRRLGLPNPIVQLTSGSDALDYIFSPDSRARRPLESHLLLLLDVKMPGEVDGIEVLRRIKADHRRRKTPVIMLTTSDDPSEVDRCYDLGCNAYMTKPVDPVEFAESINRLGSFLSIVRVPREHESSGEDSS